MKIPMQTVRLSAAARHKARQKSPLETGSKQMRKYSKTLAEDLDLENAGNE
jgi:hypothetical protein